MNWKMFLTSVDRQTPQEAQQEIEQSADGDLTVVDVRQPEEYEQGHIPGAILIPLPELESRADELGRDERLIVYCAGGVRSRSAAQILERLGFTRVTDIKGGFRIWEGQDAVGDPDQGLEVFGADHTPETALLVAYGMEIGLGDFYRELADKVESDMVRSLFVKLAAIEDKHKDKIFEEYSKLTGETDRKEFESRVVPQAMEGGLSTEQYMDRYFPNLEDGVDVIGFAMSIESQAYDLYVRAADRADNPDAASALRRIAGEEKYHLAQLGKLMGEVMFTD